MDKQKVAASYKSLAATCMDVTKRKMTFDKKRRRERYELRDDVVGVGRLELPASWSRIKIKVFNVVKKVLKTLTFSRFSFNIDLYNNISF